MANRRNIRKRQFDASKSLRLFKDYASLYQYVNGDNATQDALQTFEEMEKYENKDKIAEMFCKKKKNVEIPEINFKEEKEKDKGNDSDKSGTTGTTQFIIKHKEEDKPPVIFDFKPMGPPPTSYIKYKPKMHKMGAEQDYDKVDYMMLADEWEDIKKTSKNFNDSMHDMIEEIIDKLEKFTGHGEVPQVERCRDFIRQLNFVNKFKFPTDGVFRAIHTAWYNLRKKYGNAVMRQFHRKPDPNDSSPTSSFRARQSEKMQTRRKNKNDSSNYMKLKILRKEIYSGRQMCSQVMKREKLKMALLDLDYYELKQKLKEKMDPSYQCPEFKEFIKNEEKRTRVEFPCELSEAMRPEEKEEDKEMEDRQFSEYDDGKSIKSSKLGKKKSMMRDSAIDKSSINGHESSVNSDNYSNIEQPQRSTAPTQARADPVQSVVKPPVHEKAVVDPTTIMQIAIIYQKMHYVGIQVDNNRVKIGNHKAIKKEDYLNLPKQEIEREQYYRSGLKPKSYNEDNESCGKIKYSIFKARNGRVHILRKPQGGKYQVYSRHNDTSFKRLIPEPASSVKRLKIMENDEYEGIRNTYIPVLQNEINHQFSDFYGLDCSESEENMSDSDTKDDVDDYTSGFIERYRNRKNKKKAPGDHVISFKLNGNA